MNLVTPNKLVIVGHDVEKNSLIESDYIISYRRDKKDFDFLKMS